MSNTNDTNAPGRLSLVELTKTFSNTVSDVTAVDHINLDIRPGEFITLLGPSGCGKTTTLRMFRGCNFGPGHAGRREHGCCPAEQAPHVDGVPVLRAVPAPQRA